MNAMRRLHTIALALGKERTRTELMQFLEEVTHEDEDEVLVVLAEELSGFVPYVGGAQYAYTIIPPLEALAGAEEPVVRDKAVQALNNTAKEMNLKQTEEFFIPLIKGLSCNDWFTSRVSATGLYAVAIGKLEAEHDDARFELLSWYQGLTKDEAPMVRRAAATNLPSIIEAMTGELKFEGTIKEMLMAQLADDQDSVRLLAVDVLIAIAEALKKQGDTKYNAELIGLSIDLFTDKSWRVKYMAADRFEKLAHSMDSAELREKYVPAFVKLMKDSEGEVRTAIAKQIPGFCELINVNVILSDIVPNVEGLASDSSQHVRAALASEVTRLAPLLGKEKTIEYLVPVFLQMLKDDFPDVRLNIISKLKVVNDAIGIDLLSKSLLPAISELAKDKQWRVRLAIIEYIPLLAEQLGVEFFDEELSPLCMEWLWDSVYSIREAATKNVTKLVEVFGIDWAKVKIIPQVLKIGTNSNYLYRLTSLFAVTQLIQVLDDDAITEMILPFVIHLGDDPIPNIRFNVAKTLNIIAQSYLPTLEPEENKEDKDMVDVKDSKDEPKTSPLTITKKKPVRTEPSSQAEGVLKESIVPELEKMTEDSDVDVRYFASKSLEDLSPLVKKYLPGVEIKIVSADD